MGVWVCECKERKGFKIGGGKRKGEGEGETEGSKERGQERGKEQGHGDTA